MFCGRRKPVLDEAIAEAGQTEAKALAVACDISKADEVDALFETVVEAFGRVDLLFNNAGMGYKSTLIDEIPVEVVERHRGGQSHRLVPVRARRLSRHAQAKSAGRPHHQQRLGVGAMRRGRARCPTRRPSMPSPG